MSNVWPDVRQAVRRLGKEPGFTATLIATLALGIGTNAAVFTVVNAVFLKALPYARPSQLVYVAELDREGKSGVAGAEYAVAPANYTAWKERTGAFTDIAAVNYWLPTLGGEGPGMPLTGAAVTPNTFDVLGVAPALGTGFTPEHGLPGNERVVILSHGLWETRFAGDPRVVGLTIPLDGVAYTVIGVMPASYRHPEPQLMARTQIFRPLAWADPDTIYSRSLRGVARLRPGVTVDAGRRNLETVARQLESETPETNRGWGVVVKPLRDALFGGVGSALLMMLGGAGFVLLIVCANVANLTLARSQGRANEFAVRSALGASRGRLARQLVAESLVLTVSGGILAILGVRLGLGFLLAVQAQYISGVAEIRVDLAVVGFMMLLALVIGVAIGLLLVFQSSGAGLNASLGDGGPRSGVGVRTRRLRAGLVVAEVVLANVLVVGGCLMARSFRMLNTVDTGFDAENVLALSFLLPAHYQEQEEMAFYDGLHAKLARLHGVQAAAFVTDLPFEASDHLTWVALQDDGQVSGDRSLVEYRRVGPAYFGTMGIRLVSGRDFRPEDGRDDGEVPVIVNERMAVRYWPGREALGTTFDIAGFPSPARVVGVVGNVLDNGLDGEVEARLYEPVFFRPSRRITVALRSDLEPAGLVAAIRGEARALESEVTVTDVRRMDDLVDASLADDRIALALAAALSFLALALASVGLYGVVSYSVGQRRQEIGVRCALGADQRDVLQQVLRQSVRLTLIGTVVGLGIALPMAWLLRGFLFAIRPADPLTFTVVPVAIMVVGVAAGYLPARRAARISPAAILRGVR